MSSSSTSAVTADQLPTEQATIPVKSEDPGMATLSREAVIDRALTLADNEGFGAVSIRRIAQDFGVTPMALYWYVKNKEELLAAMGDRVLENMGRPAPFDGGGLTRLRALLAALITALSRHPGGAGPAQVRVLECESGQELAEGMLQALRHSGFSAQRSAELTGAALHTAAMLVAGHPGGDLAVPKDRRAVVQAARRTALTELPADRFPLLIEAARTLTDCADEQGYYRAGIDLFLAGVEAIAGRSTEQTLG